MPQLIAKPTRIPVPGNKLIDEFVGCVNSKDTGISIAHMHSPAGWSEPGQRPEFEEFTLVLKGILRVEHEAGVTEVAADQAIIARRGEWVRYSTPAGRRIYRYLHPAAFTHRDCSQGCLSTMKRYRPENHPVTGSAEIPSKGSDQEAKRCG